MGGDMSEELLIREARTEEADDRDRWPVMNKAWIESKNMWIIAGPAIFTRFSTFGISVISQAFIGHIGSIELAAYSLVFTVLLRFANGILLGMSSALQTLGGQAYGAKQYHMLGVYLQRSWIVLSTCGITMLPLFVYTEPILRALGQDPEIARVARTISLWLIPVMFALIASYSCQMFLQAQSKNVVIAYLAALSVAMHLFLSWLLTVKYKFGVHGAMVSTVLAYWVPNVGQLLFVMCGGCPDTWKGFSVLAFKDLWPVVKLSLSSGVMLCLEVWYNTVLVLLTGKMKNAEVSIDAIAICLNVHGWETTLSLGFLAAASVRVSNELGNGSAGAAKFSIVMAVLTSFAIGFVLFVVFLYLRGSIGYIFTENPRVAEAVADLSPLLAVAILLSSVQPVLSGVAVGAGWQSIVAYVNVGCYYLVGVPVGMVLGYAISMQVKGVWLGMLFGTFLQTVVLVIITYKTDWNKQVSLSRDRLNKWFVAEKPEDQKLKSNP